MTYEIFKQKAIVVRFVIQTLVLVKRYGKSI